LDAGCSVALCSAAVDGQAFAFEIKFPADRPAHKDVCLAATDDVTRQRCVRIIEAASPGGASSSLPDISSSAAVTPGLLTMRSVRAVNAVLAALGKPAVGGLDAPSLQTVGFSAAEVKAAGCDPASAQAAGYDTISLVATYGYDAVKTAGCDISHILVSALLCTCTHTHALTESHPLQRDGPYLYTTLHSHKVDDRTLVRDGKEPVHIPSNWEVSPCDADGIRVCAAHPWQSYYLVFSNGDVYGTLMHPHSSQIGTTRSPSKI
jgi:hypothetical protein